MTNTWHKSQPLVYLAGSVTRNPWRCVADVKRWVDACLEARLTPIVPQLSIVAEIAGWDWDHSDWLAYDFKLIDHCDALIRLPESPGADAEAVYAEERGLLVVDAGDLWPKQAAGLAYRLLNGKVAA